MNDVSTVQLSLKMTVERSKRRSFLALIFLAKSLSKSLLIRNLRFLSTVTYLGDDKPTGRLRSFRAVL